VAGVEKVSPGVVTHRVVLLGEASIIDPLSITGRDIEASVSVSD
jgi:hypothetical protein